MREQPQLSLKQVRAIEAVAKCRGFGQAALVLNTTQPVVSRAIAAAEDSLGVPLFQRGWGGTEPTAWGEHVLQRCSNALRLIDSAEEDIAAISGVRPNLKGYARWHHLDAVSAVVKFGSASAASDRLGITQPAISRAISAISDYSRQVLFERKRGGLEPTEQARRLTALRDALAQELANVRGLVSIEGRGLMGRLAVGMLPFSGQDLIARAFGDLTRTHPDLRLVAVPGSYDMLAEALRRSEIDCFVGILRNPAPYSELAEKFLYYERFTLMARADHPCHGREMNLRTLREERWIVAQHGTPARDYFESLFQTTGETPPAQTCEILSFSNAEKLIVNSDSIALLTYSRHQLQRLPPQLKRVDVDLPGGYSAVGITFRQAGATSEILKAFEDSMRQHMAADDLELELPVSAR